MLRRKRRGIRPEEIKDAKEEGLADGKHIGKIYTLKEIVKNMLSENEDIDKIMKITGLSKDEINQIKK